MKTLFCIVIFVFCFRLYPQKGTMDFNKHVLVQQLKQAHSDQDWFVPLKTATRGLTQEQAQWKEHAETHSITELISHLTFWNERTLIAFKGETLPDFNDDNETTFTVFSTADWSTTLRKLDSLHTELELAITNASDEKVREWNSDILGLTSHTAYHTGQIVYIRKLNNWWAQ